MKCSPPTGIDTGVSESLCRKKAQVTVTSGTASFRRFVSDCSAERPGGGIIPGTYSNLFNETDRGYLLVGAIIGAVLGIPLGLFAGVVAGVAGATTSDPRYAFRIHCIVSASAFCAIAALAGWVVVQFLVAAWAGC
jgi:hypothetical protein